MLQGLALLLCAAKLGAAEPNGSLPGNAATQPAGGWFAPAAIAAGEDGKVVFVAGAEAREVLALDVAQGKVVQQFRVPGRPSGLALDGQRLYVTCAAPESRICEINTADGRIEAQTVTGHTALDPVLSPDRKTLYVCLKFNNQVAEWDTASRRERRRIDVGREPVSAAPSLDGKWLLVAHHLPVGPASAPLVAATIGIIDLTEGKLVSELPLPNGSSLLREIRISPDGRYAALAHNLGHFQVPTTQLERGWMNTSALTLLDVATLKVLGTVLLDEVDRGAANPWAVGWSGDGRRLFVSHAGTHEVSLIDCPALLGKLAKPSDTVGGGSIAPTDDLAFLGDTRRRVKLAGRGPRAMVVSGEGVFVAGYFSDSIETLEAGSERAGLLPVRLNSLAAPAPDCGPEPAFAGLRQGEELFNDATICFQGWQSCASCHSEDARVDGLNWDLLNDGLGNPKNTKSLLLAHKTPPAMSMGVRITAEEAVRAGLQHILFTAPSEDVARPLDRWLASLTPMPSPHLDHDRLSAAAERGRRVFNRPDTACAVCHRPGLFTDLNAYEVGTAGPMDAEHSRFDTPSLVEAWRTAPYLHDGSAATLRDVLTTRNRADRHGRTAHLSPEELNDLVEYLLSL